MSKKKQPKNGFFFYMKDMQDELRRQGKYVPMSEMPVLAGPRWSKLSDGEKLAYNTRAKLEKYRSRNMEAPAAGLVARPGKKDCTGEELASRRDIRAESTERRRREREELKASLPLGDAIMTKRFFFLDILPLCELFDLGEDRLIPCEVAAVEYSLAHGIHRSMHMFIDPGPIPVGYRYDAQRQSDSTHCVPLDGFELACKDYRHVLQTLEQFLTPKESEVPFVFSKKARAEKTEFCLHWLMKRAGVAIGIERVFELEILMIEMAARCSGGVFLSVFQATDYLSTTCFDFESGTRCSWHEAREIRHCSLNIVNIYCFVISELLCPKFGISYTGNHLPMKPDKPTANVIVPSRKHPSAPLPSLVSATTDSKSSSLASSAPLMGLGRGRGRGRGLAQTFRMPNVSTPRAS